MNLQLNDRHLGLLRDCNEHSLRYLLRDDYHWANPKQPLPSQTMHLWLDAPYSPEEQKLYFKILANGERNLAPQNGFLCPCVLAMPSREFDQAYEERIIANYQGLKINFHRSDSVKDLETPSSSFQLNLSVERNRFIIHSLNFYQVAYMLVDEYPIPNPLNGHNGKDSLVVWLQPTEDNGKRFRKASELFAGNAPSIKEFCSPNRRYIQGSSYFQNYFQSLDFAQLYQKRDIINYKGLEVNFAPL